MTRKILLSAIAVLSLLVAMPYSRNNALLAPVVAATGVPQGGFNRGPQGDLTVDCTDANGNIVACNTGGGGGGGGINGNYNGNATPTPFPAPTQTSQVQVDANDNLQTNLQAVKPGVILPVQRVGNTYQVITASGLTTIVNPGPAVLMGVRNLYDAQQPAGNCAIYDGTTAAGTLIWSENGIYQDQQWTDPGGTIALTAIVINCAVAPTAPGLLVETHL